MRLDFFYPGDFLGEICFILKSTSLRVKARGGRSICRLESRKFLTSLILFGDRILYCGSKVLTKCFAKIFACSCSEIAQLPLSLCKVGGGFWIRKSFLVAFQRVPSRCESEDV